MDPHLKLTIVPDPLKTLRLFNISRKKIVERDGRIEFGSISWPRKLKTNYLRCDSSKSDKKKKYYNLESLLFLLKNVYKSHSKYVKRAKNSNIHAVKKCDRENVLAYLFGEIEESSRIYKKASKAEANNTVLLIKEKRNKIRESTARLDTPKEAITLDRYGSNSGMSIERQSDVKSKLSFTKKSTLHHKHDNSNVHELKEYNAESASAVVSHEKFGRTRNDVLQCRKEKDLAKSVSRVLKDENARKNNASEALGNESHLEYNRYMQERFIQTSVIKFNGFKIKTNESFMEYFCELSKRAAEKKNADALAMKQVKTSRMMPIIVVPNTLTSLVNMFNVKDVLEGLKFVFVDSKRASLIQKDSEVIIVHSIEGTDYVIDYKVVDVTEDLTRDEWDRVVAVFVLGPAWHFKGWPWEGNPVKIFENICAFHVKFDDEVLDANVAKWNVKVLEISRTGRHQDSASFSQFWKVMDNSMKARRPLH